MLLRVVFGMIAFSGSRRHEIMAVMGAVGYVLGKADR
jgi:hypothetical protein